MNEIYFEPIRFKNRPTLNIFLWITLILYALVGIALVAGIIFVEPRGYYSEREKIFLYGCFIVIALGAFLGSLMTYALIKTGDKWLWIAPKFLWINVAWVAVWCAIVFLYVIIFDS